jgi:carboxyl-terminal processing protease
MRLLERLGKLCVVFGVCALATFFATSFGGGSLWQTFDPALAGTGSAGSPKAPYDLTRLEAVNETLKMIRDKYVDPDRVKPKEMLLSALNYVQRDVAQVIVLTDDPNEVTVRVETNEKKFRVDNIQGPWDVSARLREVFAFLQKNLRGTEVDLREVEYAACNGMLHTLDPHSVFLSPEAYKEMNLSTSGAFGGLGIVISIRDQLLTVMNPMPETPAGRAGLKRFDRIVKINNESTLNMPLDDAVRRLRGDPGTKVTVWVTRDGDGGWQGTKPFELTREQIKVRSVESRALADGVGYVRLKQFQQSSFAELEAALEELRQKGPIKGLVLDLRGNPGGLLDQAARIADKFLADGVIVSTVGASEGREEKRAKGAGTEPAYPVVVLVSGTSASASEIVAGALKNQNRALIVGAQTFGKGSVQLVFPDITSEKAALKLTIAQYLTPGDVSIQGVGVVPDIELDPMTVDDLEMDLTVQKDGLRERDLSASLSSARAAPASKPLEVVRYQLSSAEREEMRERGGDIDDTFELDFPIKFAQAIVGRMPPNTGRLEQLRAVQESIEQTRKQELDKVSTELSRMGVDWSDAPPDAAGTPVKPELEIKVETDRPNAEVTAGEPMELRVSVKNNGKQPVYRLRASTESDSPYFEGKELIFGKIAPGQAKTAKAPLGWCEVEGRKAGTTKPRDKNAKRICKIPMDALARSDGLKVKFEAAGAAEPPAAEVRPTVRALERPLFQYAYQIVDDKNGNGDGRVQRGELVSMYLTVKNIGKGRSYDTQANIANASGDGLLLHAGRFDISNMSPGDTRRVAFTFDVQQQLAESEAALTLSVGDRDLREFASEKVKIPVQSAAAVTKATGAVKAGAQGANLLSSPDATAKPFGRLAAGASVGLLGKTNGFEKVDLGGGRFAFVASGEVAAGGGAPGGTITFEDIYSHAPPQVDVRTAAMATKDEKIKISGSASDPEKLLDVYVFVGSRKVFYKSNRDGADPKKMTFEFDAQLRPGVNPITVVARENSDTTTRRTLIVRKDGPDGAILKTPKTDDPVADWLSPGAPGED